MTYAAAIRDIKANPKDYKTLSNAFFSSFLEIKKVRKDQILEREAELSQLCRMLSRKLVRDPLTREEKIALMDYIENLQLALDDLEEMREPSIKEGRIKAARHLAKKMQSSVSD